VTAEVIALAIAGFVAPFIIDVLKRWWGLQDEKALWFAFACSVIIACLATTLAGVFKPGSGWGLVDWSDPLKAIAQIAAMAGPVFTLATLVYWRILKSK